MHSPFSSRATFRDAFKAGLEQLLHSHDELGVYILVLANAGFDIKIWAHLAQPLRKKFEMLASAYHEQQRLGLEAEGAADDLDVFRQLLALGFDGLEHTAFHRQGPWEVQYNPLRSFRPPRISGGLIEGIQAPFNPDGFHFAKPFLAKEIFWQGELFGRNSALFYNKFPFVELHGLLVPEHQEGNQQFLRKEDHDYIWELTEQLGEKIEGVGFGYNSYGAYASVNHLHFQMFVRSRPLPIARPRWRHNGGVINYPVECKPFSSKSEAWEYLNGLHQEQRAYNLAYLPGMLYCTPRQQQGSVPVAPWSSGFAWHEMMGSFSLFDHAAFLRLTEKDLTRALAAAGTTT
ncbi:MAG: hypothetical protein ROD09_18145 [Candidatus Sedimenticola sp. (ex Thyasira tokunagai)]